MLGAIKHVDLIGAEFKKHRKCFREYTRILSETSNKEEIKESQPVYEKDYFESVCKTTDNKIIYQGKCMATDTWKKSIYGENADEKESTYSI